jgi:hypothetical protein
MKEAFVKNLIVQPKKSWTFLTGHDAWVIGDEACIAFDFEYLKK